MDSSDMHGELPSGRIDRELDLAHDQHLEPYPDLDHAALNLALSRAVEAAFDLVHHPLAVSRAQLGEEPPVVEGSLVVLGQDRDVARSEERRVGKEGRS